MILLTIAGGVVFILIGVRYLRKGLDRIFGPTLGRFVKRVAKRPFSSFFTGIAVATAAPSSTTITLLAMQTVQATHANARQMLAMMYGADIGLTLPVVLISFNIEQYAPIFVLIGGLLYLFIKTTVTRGIGQSILALGIIFTGIATIKHITQTVPADGDFAAILQIISNHHATIAIAAAIIAVLLQSSTATIGFIIALVSSGSIKTLEPAIAVVVGANVGIAITALIAGWPHIESRRLASTILLSKTIIAVVFIAFLSQITQLLTLLPAPANNQQVYIGYAHVAFNLTMACIGMPLVKPTASLIASFIPVPVTSSTIFSARYITNAGFDSPSLALGQSAREITHAAELVRLMLVDAWRALQTNDKQLIDSLRGRDDQIDQLDKEIKQYLTRLSTQDLSPTEAKIQIQQLRYINELETAGDIIDKNLSEVIDKKITKRTSFSEQGNAELNSFYNRIIENMIIAETAATTHDRDLAQQLIRHKEHLDQLENTLRDQHFARLNAGLNESHETSAIHLDLLIYLRRINSHITHIAFTILEQNC